MDQRGSRHIVALFALLAALVLSGMLVLAGLSAGRARAEANGTSMAARVEAILAQPRGFLYKNVTVRGQVTRIWGAHMVALRSHSVRQGLLIVLAAQNSAGVDLRVGQSVEVTGRVRPMSRAELQALRQSLAADVSGDSLLAIFGGDPYVLADEVKPVQ